MNKVLIYGIRGWTDRRALESVLIKTLLPQEINRKDLLQLVGIEHPSFLKVVEGLCQENNIQFRKYPTCKLLEDFKLKVQRIFDENEFQFCLSFYDLDPRHPEEILKLKTIYNLCFERGYSLYEVTHTTKWDEPFIIQYYTSAEEYSRLVPVNLLLELSKAE